MAEPEKTPTDFTKFRQTTRALVGLGGYSRLTAPLELYTIAQTGHGLDPRGVPVRALQVMSSHPAVYLAEQTIGGIVKRPDLFTVKHEDPAVIAQVDAWLRPILPDILAAAVRAFAYGSVALVFDWKRGPLRFKVPTSEGSAKAGQPRAKTAATYTYFSRACEVHPDETQVNLDEWGDFNGITCFGGTVDKGRSYLWCWDPEFGDLQGQGARRRSWRDYCESLLIGLLQAKYLERSVDPLRVIYVPEGKVVVDGVEWDIPAYMTDLLMSAQGSGALAIPSTRWKTNDGPNQGERQYELNAFELPDRSTVWRSALNRADSNIMLGYLVAPSMAGVDDVDTAGASRTKETMLREFIENLAVWVATGLTRIVHKVQLANPNPPDELAEVVATDVGKAGARRILQTVLQIVAASPTSEVAIRTDVPAALDRLGVPVRDEAPPEVQELLDREKKAAEAKAADPFGKKPNGRPTDAAGKREDRRDAATTPDGAEDTGGKQERDGSTTDARAMSVATQKAIVDLQTVSAMLVAKMAKDEPTPPGNLTLNVTVPEREVNNNITVPEREVNISAPVDARTTIAEGAVTIAEGAVQVDAPVTVPERTTNLEVNIPPGGGTQTVKFTRGLDGKIVSAEAKKE